MPTPQQTANLAYKTSLELTELKNAFEDFKKICVSYNRFNISESVDPELYAEKRDSQALLIRLGAKYLVLFYLQGYAQERFAMLQSFLKAGIEQSEASGFAKTGDLCRALGTYMQSVHEVVLRAVELVSGIRDSDGRRSTDDVELFESTKETFLKTLAELSETLADRTPFPEDVRMPSIKGDLLRNFREEIEWIDRQLGAIRRASAELFVKENTIPLSEIATLPRAVLAPSPVRMDSIPIITILSTPFPDEAIFAVRAYGEENKKSFYLVSATLFVKGTDAEDAELFKLLKAPQVHLIFTDIKEVPENRRAFLYQHILRLGTKDNQIFVIDTVGDRRVYDDMSQIADSMPNLDPTALDYIFLKMPPYADVVNTFDTSGIVENMTEAVRERIRRNLPFMGYVGLSNCIAEYHKGHDAFGTGERLSETNRPTALAYLSRLVASYQFIDNEWGDYSQGITRTGGEKRAFDYDVVRTVNPENLRIILNAPGFTFFERCALAVRYCTLGGDDVSVWPELPREEKEIRMQQASVVLCSLLNNRYTPKVQVLDEEEWREHDPKGGAGGLCCAGGKLLLYRHKCVNNFEYCLHVTFHECFHGFQHTACNEPYADWYFDDLGVTKGRIDKWAMNSSCYHEFTMGSDGYRYGITEGDANNFADDCQLYAKSRWHELELV